MKLLIILILLIPTLSFSQMENIKWDYPIKPGSEEWKTFKSSEEMVKACQIPENVLNKISTEYLLNICLKYPMFFDIHFSNNLQDGLDIIIPSFNGMDALFKRENCPESLINLYKNEIPKEPHIKNGNNKFKLFYLELLLSQNNVIRRLNKNQKEELLKTALKKISEKKEKKYSGYYQLSSALILSRLINTSDINNELYNDELLNKFNRKGTLIDSISIEKLIKIAGKYNDLK